MAELFLLYESAAGYVLAHVKDWEQICQDAPSVRAACADISRFGQVVTIKTFYPFKNAAEALENMAAICEGTSTELLRSLLDQNLPKKRKTVRLGVSDPALAKDLTAYKFSVVIDKNVTELLRACRMHHNRLVKQQSLSDLQKAQVGLGHAFSRQRIQFDPNRQDKPIQHAIALLDNLDKTTNLMTMRLREWYGAHFPELSKIVTDNRKYSEVVNLIKMRDSFKIGRRQELVDLLLGNESVADEVLDAMKITLGQDISEADMVMIERFATNVVKLAEERSHAAEFLQRRLAVVAPNMQSLIGDLLSARLIAHAGSLVNLAKYPASTVQILGAEKALFRALKTKTNTPKYGLIFQSTFIGRAAMKNKGRISRYLANKISLASRIDNFTTVQSSLFGEKMREQVEERMKFLTDRIAPRKNLDVMREAVSEYGAVVQQLQKQLKKKKSKKEKRVKAVV